MREHKTAQHEEQIDQEVKRELPRAAAAGNDLRTPEMSIGNAERSDAAKAVQRFEAPAR